VNSTVTFIDLGAYDSKLVRSLMARNTRFRRIFLFDARQMRLSLMCADECGVVWPYLLESGDTDGVAVPDNLGSIRAEFSSVLAERRRLHSQG
jgi:hypothetical protein